jgi:hypothetical protein
MLAICSAASSDRARLSRALAGGLSAQRSRKRLALRALELDRDEVEALAQSGRRAHGLDAVLATAALYEHVLRDAAVRGVSLSRCVRDRLEAHLALEVGAPRRRREEGRSSEGAAVLLASPPGFACIRSHGGIPRD